MTSFYHQTFQPLFLTSCYVVNSPTRGNNILDIYATNRPALAHLVDVIPGISDHEMIKVASNLSPHLFKLKECKIYLWNKANLSAK